jgi:hypothetical protein
MASEWKSVVNKFNKRASKQTLLERASKATKQMFSSCMSSRIGVAENLVNTKWAWLQRTKRGEKISSRTSSHIRVAETLINV